MLLNYLLLLKVAICIASPHRSLAHRYREELIRKTKLASYDILLQEWETFKDKYNKVYYSEEEHLMRLNIFAENTKLIAEHNDLYNKGAVTFSMEMNKFGDRTADELKRLCGFRYRKIETNSTYLPLPDTAIPVEKDWRALGAVTAVKNQGNCGSCWAFSAVGALEGQVFRKTKVLVELSEQNLIDCSYGFGNDGCEGGNAQDAFKYIEENGGIDTEKSYPYEEYDAECRYSERYTAATTKGYTAIAADEKSLQRAVAGYGPISVGIHTGGYSFIFYKTGIYFNASCLSDYADLDHEVLLVGYGQANNSGDYWLVKNSWGEDWGENGYIRMARNRNNNCGIANAAVLPIV